ncbi:unnamed protein product [Nippostrongylus brasiliensis]|uniref:F-box domain-containing protein n=1 Tax=Nippostrongylus brasiliensis TaxID=27835 RepID=A0A0N4YPR3_NIPBR|nr:unnamed protein product [Nippostrongylus brasiliensis]
MNVDAQPTIKRKNTFPCLANTSSHDFRKDYKNSILERKSGRKKLDGIDSSRLLSAWRVFTEYLFGRSSRKPSMLSDEPTSSSGPAQIPAELLFKILGNVDRSTALSCRAVCSRWRRAIDILALDDQLFAPIELQISRLIVSPLPKKAIEIRRVAYDAQHCSAIVVTQAMLRRHARLSFSFGQFRIKRIILKGVNLTDELVDFLRLQLSMCNLAPLTQLSLHCVDFSNSNSVTLHRLLAPVAKHLEVFELSQSVGMRPDSATDAHIAQLDPMKIRRIAIDGVRFGHQRRRPMLRIGDESLRRLAEQKCYPTLVLDRCSVTTAMGWFASAGETERCIRSQICTVKRCSAVRGPQFEAECRRRGLHCRHRRGSGSLMLYNVQAEHAQSEFTVATQPLDSDELKKNK